MRRVMGLILERRTTFPLYAEQRLFCLQPTREPRQRVVRSNHTMAWNEDADAIGSNGLRHSSYALQIVNP